MPEENKRKRLKIGGILVLIFSLLYIPSLFHWLSGDNINVDYLRIGVIEESVNADGLLVRDEVLLDPPASDGRFIPVAAEGQRIPAFSNVATITDDISLQLLDELEDVNANIIRVQNERAQKTDFFSEDIARLNKSIGEKIRGIISLCNTNSMADMEQLTLEVDRLIEKKAEIAGNDDNDKNIKALKQKKLEIQQEINSNTSKVVSEYSGIVSYMIDGYEQELVPDKIKETITPEVINKAGENSSRTYQAYGEAEAGKPFIKIIRGNYTYIVSSLEKAEASLFKENDRLDIRPAGIGNTVKGMVTGLWEKDGKYIIAVRIDRLSEELSSIRKVSLDLIKDYHEGLKIPLKALYANNADWTRARVMLIRSNCAKETEVEVLCRDEEYAIIATPANEMDETVILYDRYILNPENIKEGQIVLK